MEKLTVLQLSKRTGLSRTQIYYLQRLKKINIINGKIILEEAIPAIIELLDKKLNKDNEINFNQILNLLIAQNISLQTQLNSAHKREKTYLTELVSYRQHYAQKTAKIPPKDEGNTQVGQGNNFGDSNEISQNPIQSKIENQAHLESCQNNKEQIESMNEAENPPLPIESIHNKTTLPESKCCDTGPKNESTEKSDDAVNGTPFPTCDDTKPVLNKNRQRKPIAQLVKLRTKNVSIIPTSRKSESTLINKSIADQDSLDKKVHHDYDQ